MFTSGLKTAAFDRNNQGLEFKMSDMDNTNGAVGPGGMGPSGFATYQPTEKNISGKSKTRPKSLTEVAHIIYKMSGASDAALSDSGGSDIAPGTVDQLKYTSQSGPTLEQESADREELKNRRKALIKTRTK